MSPHDEEVSLLRIFRSPEIARDGAREVAAGESWCRPPWRQQLTGIIITPGPGSCTALWHMPLGSGEGGFIDRGSRYIQLLFWGNLFSPTLRVLRRNIEMEIVIASEFQVWSLENNRDSQTNAEHSIESHWSLDKVEFNVDEMIISTRGWRDCQWCC